MARQRNPHYDTEFVQQHIALALAELRARHQGFLDYCIAMRPVGSPLEMAFLVWWHLLAPIGDPDFTLIEQHEIVTNGRAYRLDFSVEPCLVPLNNGPILRLAIELDGHEFHERTREQVTSRNQRDRDLAAAGWRVLHFSGSEFHRDPARCINEVARIAYERYYEWTRQGSVDATGPVSAPEGGSLSEGVQLDGSRGASVVNGISARS